MADDPIKVPQTHAKLPIATPKDLQNKSLVRDLKEHSNFFHTVLDLAKLAAENKEAEQELIHKMAVGEALRSIIPVTPSTDLESVLLRLITATPPLVAFPTPLAAEHMTRLFLKSLQPNGIEIGILDLPDDATILAAGFQKPNPAGGGLPPVADPDAFMVYFTDNFLPQAIDLLNRLPAGTTLNKKSQDDMSTVLAAIDLNGPENFAAFKQGLIAKRDELRMTTGKLNAPAMGAATAGVIPPHKPLGAAPAATGSSAADLNTLEKLLTGTDAEIELRLQPQWNYINYLKSGIVSSKALDIRNNIRAIPVYNPTITTWLDGDARTPITTPLDTLRAPTATPEQRAIAEAIDAVSISPAIIPPATTSAREKEISRLKEEVTKLRTTIYANKQDELDHLLTLLPSDAELEIFERQGRHLGAASATTQIAKAIEAAWDNAPDLATARANAQAEAMRVAGTHTAFTGKPPADTVERVTRMANAIKTVANGAARRNGGSAAEQLEAAQNAVKKEVEFILEVEQLIDYLDSIQTIYKDARVTPANSQTLTALEQVANLAFTLRRERTALQASGFDPGSGTRPTGTHIHANIAFIQERKANEAALSVYATDLNSKQKLADKGSHYGNLNTAHPKEAQKAGPEEDKWESARNEDFIATTTTAKSGIAGNLANRVTGTITVDADTVAIPFDQQTSEKQKPLVNLYLDLERNCIITSKNFAIGRKGNFLAAAEIRTKYIDLLMYDVALHNNQQDATKQSLAKPQEAIDKNLDCDLGKGRLTSLLNAGKIKGLLPPQDASPPAPAGSKTLYVCEAHSDVNTPWVFVFRATVAPDGTVTNRTIPSDAENKIIYQHMMAVAEQGLNAHHKVRETASAADVTLLPATTAKVTQFTIKPTTPVVAPPPVTVPAPKPIPYWEHHQQKLKAAAAASSDPNKKPGMMDKMKDLKDGVRKFFFH